MNRATMTLLWRLVVFSLLLACPVSVHSAEPMIVGVAGPAINMVYAFVARDAGFFQKHGLDVRIVVFDAGSILAQAALSGEVKVAVSSGPATIASRTQGADTIIIAACVNTLPYSLVAAKGITKWDQIKGRKSPSAASVRERTPRSDWCSKDLASIQSKMSPSFSSAPSRAASKLWRPAPSMRRSYRRP